MAERAAINLAQWIDDHRDVLKPPVGNAQVWEDREFIIMIVAGPNARTDFHVNEGEEFFYQLEGDMVLRVMEESGPRDIPIREGEIYLLGAGVPHSPQRPAGTVGLVVERRRNPGEIDRLRWYCPGCNAVLHEASFNLKNIATELKPIIEGFYADESLRTCGACGAVMQPPAG